jgi:hypothetical protein
MRIPTVTVNIDGVPVVINQSDYRPGVHLRWGEEKPKAPEVQKPADEQDELLAKLAARGINKDRRTSVEKLRKLLGE